MVRADVPADPASLDLPAGAGQDVVDANAVKPARRRVTKGVAVSTTGRSEGVGEGTPVALEQLAFGRQVHVARHDRRAGQRGDPAAGGRRLFRTPLEVGA